MRAATFVAPFEVAVTEVADPDVVEPGDAVVAVELAGLCGSDLHPYRGSETGLDSGTVLGHEFVGEVVASGTEVRTHRVGERVVSPFSTSCGRCFYCSRALTARCERGQLFGWVEKGHGLHGGQAQLVRVPLADTTLVRVPDDVVSPVAALLAGDNLATALFAVDAGDVEPGMTVAVVGCGSVGLMSIVAAREAGASAIWSTDTIDERLALAAAFGAVAVRADSAPEVALHESTSGRGADVVIEAVGTPQATAAAYSMVRPGGTIVAAGVHTEQNLGVTPGQLYDKNLTYRAGRSSARAHVEDALRLAASCPAELTSVVSHTMPLADATEAYALFADRRDGCTKVVFTP